MDNAITSMAGFTRAWVRHGFYRVIYFSYLVATGFRASGIWSGQAQSGLVLAGHFYSYNSQYAGGSLKLVDGLWRAQSCGQIQPVCTPWTGCTLAGKARSQSLFAVLVAIGGRPAVRRGGLVALVLLALCYLHGNRQVCPVCFDDGQFDLGISRRLEFQLTFVFPFCARPFTEKRRGLQRKSKKGFLFF